MKTFWATFAAILAAFAVIYGINSALSAKREAAAAVEKIKQEERQEVIDQARIFSADIQVEIIEKDTIKSARLPEAIRSLDALIAAMNQGPKETASIRRHLQNIIEGHEALRTFIAKQFPGETTWLDEQGSRLATLRKFLD